MRGGARKKRTILTGQQALLDYIWKSHGGVGKVANKLDKPPQTCVNWRNRGKVPLLDCRTVEETLHIPIWGLNYLELQKMFLVVPSWKLVVASYGLSPGTVKYILSLEAPKTL
jgi:hypothetical protein